MNKFFALFVMLATSACAFQRAYEVAGIPLQGDTGAISAGDVSSIQNAVNEIRKKPSKLNLIFIKSHNEVEVTVAGDTSLSGDYIFLIKSDGIWIQDPRRQNATWII